MYSTLVAMFNTMVAMHSKMVAMDSSDGRYGQQQNG